MTRDVQITLQPANQVLVAVAGSSLQDLLFEQGMEFPCGGNGTCGKCRVRVIRGELDTSTEDVAQLGQQAVAEGWRLACCANVSKDVSIQLAQFDASVLMDDTAVAVSPRPGWGIAIDLGTTTIAAQLVDLSTGNVLAFHSGLNPQTRHGADIMSRVQYAVNGNGNGGDRLKAMIHDALGNMVEQLCRDATANLESTQPLLEIIIVGNTVMHHLFCGHDLSPLAACPFDSPRLAEQRLTSAELGWNLSNSAVVRFLPCLGGFIGSDLLAGVIASGMDQSDRLQVLVDLGTNGEMIVSDGHRMLGAATAAGPAFEGAKIQMGMRAAAGAIDRVRDVGTRYECHVIGNVPAKGICGSGLIDAIASARRIGDVDPSGRWVRGGVRLNLEDPVSLHQCDIRELQLAKGAIAAGVEILLGKLGHTVDDVADYFLCGAFGNYLDIHNAVQLGLLTCDETKVSAMGNTALRGAKTILLSDGGTDNRIARICSRVERFGLSEDVHFMDVYVSHMHFPS
ncbi:ASKHA domain-containing protein [Novipirellula artificiosorum]|uniref:Na(+)-translocating NADH-quinone reductase subunit F n=1 Tax=Novipirellula artificiosorum TaxID=2528016 RepID=A0A5C6DV42_9BACT|nr:ASKHA domain-containing protein [Novipirellula artificiosorum]TWU40560.1 Na(+)-translocating NADH-quinone reductase subunit F [Novipirellula artificiosorum]